MSTITVFSGMFCQKEMIIKELAEKTGCRLINDDDVIGKTSSMSGIEKKKLVTVFDSRKSVFNKFTHERERSIAWLRLAIAEILNEDKLIIDGYCSHLVPGKVSHVLSVCLIAERKSRIENGQKENKKKENEIIQSIHKFDEDCAAWVNSIKKTNDPWDSSLYDIIIPTDKMDIAASVKLIEENLRSEVIRPTEESKLAVKDFILSSQVGVAMAKEGHNVNVTARDGSITVTINNNVLLLKKLEEELKNIAEKVDGVKSVETRIGKGFHKSDIYRKYDFDMPKLLLVDDEREFVKTLSERLLMRDVSSAVAYDGESALEILNDDEPDVIILDLKMPGIDGYEVLKKTKQKSPDTEVIILTGHGSEKDREECMALGAFAYLQKPVDIDVLTETLKKAKEKMEKNKDDTNS